MAARAKRPILAAALLRDSVLRGVVHAQELRQAGFRAIGQVSERVVADWAGIDIGGSAGGVGCLTGAPEFIELAHARIIARGIPIGAGKGLLKGWSHANLP